MSDLADRLLGLEEIGEATRQKDTRPPGWDPGVRWDGNSGEITTGALTEPPTDWSDLLRARGLDPEVYEVDGDTLKWCSWDGWFRGEQGEAAVSKTCYSFRATIRLKRGKSISLEELYVQARKAKAPKKDSKTGESALVIALADFQCGNGDVELSEQLRVLAELPEKLADRSSDARKRFGLGEIVVVGMGDLVEGCHSFYSYQPFSTTLDRREQVRVTRRAVLDILTKLNKVGLPIKATAVAGNHGEHRVGGKRVTGPGDNDDLSIFEQVADILSVNPDAFSNIDVRVPKDRLAVSLNVGGQIVAFTHGHIIKPSGGPMNGIWTWWQKQAHGRHFPGVADANILICGHYHHFSAKEEHGRAAFICPTLTPVGSYWGDANGTRPATGTLTLVTNPDGWTGLEIVR